MVEDLITRVYVWFGDGSWARLVSVEPIVRDGIRSWLMEIQPSTDMIMRFNLERGEEKDINPRRGTIMRWYPQTIAWQLNPNPYEGIWLVTTTVNGGRTGLSLKYVEFTQHIDDLQKENDILRGEIQKIYEDYDKLATMQDEKITKDMDIAMKIRRVGGRLPEDEKEKK